MNILASMVDKRYSIFMERMDHADCAEQFMVLTKVRNKDDTGYFEF